MSEHDEQAALVMWARLRAGVEPRLRLLYAIPNGGLRHKATAARLHAEGVQSGVPDLCLACPGVMGHALYIEMKTRSGRLTPEQITWREALIAAGNGYVLARSWVDAACVICRHLDRADLAAEVRA